MDKETINKNRHAIPRQLTQEQFNQYILPHLSKGKRGPESKISFFKIFNYILKLIHTGVQWEELPIDLDEDGKPELHYSRIFRFYQRWLNDGSLESAFKKYAGATQ